MFSKHSVFKGNGQEHDRGGDGGGGRLVVDGGEGRVGTEGTEDLLVYRRVAQNAVLGFKNAVSFIFSQGPTAASRLGFSINK